MSIAADKCVIFDCAGDACVGILHPASTRCGDLGVLIVVGGPQYRVGSHRQFVLLARQLAAAGYPVFRFDYRGMGDSEGVQRDFQQVADDLLVAMNAFMRADSEVQRIVIFGLCDAASAALMHGADDPRLAGLMLANPWVRTEEGLARAHVQHYYRGRVFQKTFWKKVFSGRLDARRALGSFFGALTRANRPATSAKDGPANHFVERMLAGLERRRYPTLWILSGRDLTAREFEDQVGRDPRWSSALAGPTVSRHDLHQADHTFSSKTDAESLGRICVDWLGKMPSRGGK